MRVQKLRVFVVVFPGSKLLIQQRLAKSGFATDRTVKDC